MCYNKNMNDRIEARAEVCGGEPCVKGTRVPVRVVLSHLAAGESAEDVVRALPSVTIDDVRACLEYASYLATEHVA